MSRRWASYASLVRMLFRVAWERGHGISLTGQRLVAAAEMEQMRAVARGETGLGRSGDAGGAEQ